MRVPASALLSLLSLFGSSPPLQAAPLVSIAAVTPTVTIGNTFRVDVRISDVADLFAFEFAGLIFDPSLLRALDVLNPESFFTPADRPLFAIDNTTGRIDLVAATLAGAEPGVGPGGVLFSSLFRAGSVGTATVTLDVTGSNMLLDSSLDAIAFTVEGAGVARVAVRPDSVPEPEVLTLISLGAAGTCCSRLRRRRASLSR